MHWRICECKKKSCCWCSVASADSFWNLVSHCFGPWRFYFLTKLVLVIDHISRGCFIWHGLCPLAWWITAADNELRLLVDAVMTHYDEIFRLKSIGTKADVFHMLSGMWKTPAERCFMWLGGFRSSELLKVIIDHLSWDFCLCSLLVNCFNWLIFKFFFFLL